MLPLQIKSWKSIKWTCFAVCFQNASPLPPPPRCWDTYLEIKIGLWEVLVQRRRQKLCCHYDDAAESKHYTVSLQNEVADKNRWKKKKMQHKRHLQSRIIWREADLMCTLTVARTKTAQQEWEKQTHWLVRSLMTLQSRGKMVSFIRLRNTQKIFNRNSCTNILTKLKQSRYVVGRPRQNAVIFLGFVTQRISPPSAPPCYESCSVDGESGSLSFVEAEREDRKHTPPAQEKMTDMDAHI